MYWFGRYVERTENMARLISVNTNLVLDLPKVKYIWGSLISITGYEEKFFSRFSVVDEKNVIKFLLDDDSSSIMNAVTMARENARTTREIMPREAWIKINRLYLHLEKNLSRGYKRDGRHQLLAEIVERCQELNGYLLGCMSFNDAYHFMKIGTNIERADMTTRILDVGCLNLLHPEYPEIREYESLLWMNVLMSLTAYQMYRQHVDDNVNGEDVSEFLLKDNIFPRAVAQCFNQINESFQVLPNNEDALRGVTAAQRIISNSRVSELLASETLHDFVDDIQLEISRIHNQIVSTWFDYELD
jgi:uncharacterized alpha-E superfamily protein